MWGEMIRNHIKKIILLGDSGVGKTSLMNRYVNNNFSENYKSTIGADFLTKDVKLTEKEGEDKFLSLQIWDTAGQERYQSLGAAFYKGADACILVFDITNYESFQKIDQWCQEFMDKSQTQKEDDMPFVLVGNKSDLQIQRTVTRNEIDIWIKESDLNIKYYESSAKNSSNVDDLFVHISRELLKKVDDSTYDVESLETINNIKESEKPKKCCFMTVS